MRSASTAESPNESTEQWGTPSSNLYGHQISYGSLPSNPLSSHQQYPTASTSFGSEARSGLPAAQNAQSGFDGLYGASSQPTAPSGYYQGHYGSLHSQHQAPGLSIESPHSNPQYFSSQTTQPGYSSHYSHAGAHMTVPTSPYQPGGLQESSWSTEYDNQSRDHARQMESPGAQYNAAAPGQSAPSVFPDPYSARLGEIATSGQQANLTPADEMPDASRPIPIPRRQSMYPGSYMAKVDPNIAQPESERPSSYGDDSAVDVRIEVAGTRSSKGMYSQYS